MYVDGLNKPVDILVDKTPENDVPSLDVPSEENSDSNPEDDNQKLDFPSEETPDSVPEEAAPNLVERIDTEIETTKEADAVLNQELQLAFTQSALNQLTMQLYELWDDTLNCVWEILTETLPDTEMEVLLKKQLDWIVYKEAKIEEAGVEYEGGTIYSFMRNSTAANLTKERVYFLRAYAARWLQN